MKKYKPNPKKLHGYEHIYSLLDFIDKKLKKRNKGNILLKNHLLEFLRPTRMENGGFFF